MYLSELSKGRNNNLDIMRFFAAILVIVSHSIPISMGAGYADFLSGCTESRLSLGGLAVGMFFLIGGFLIARSVENKNNVKDFFGARIKRIFPPLILMVIIVVVFVGPIMTNMGIVEYFTNKNTYLYLLNAVMVPVHNLPGVFENNIYQNVVNGALWTLPVEFVCYILCFIAFKLKFFEKKRFIMTIPLVALIFIATWYMDSVFIISVVRAVILFYVGIGIHIFREDIKLDFVWNIVAIVMFVAMIALKLDYLAMIIVFPYIVLYFAFGVKNKYTFISKYGDLSYGMYLWGWPIGQIVCQLFGGTMEWYVNSVITIVFVIVLARISAQIVEGKLLRQRS